LTLVCLMNETSNMRMNLMNLKDQLEKLFSDKIHKMMSVQKSHGDKVDLGFVDTCLSPYLLLMKKKIWF